MYDQSQLERDLMQQDTDLAIRLKECIQQIYESQQVTDRRVRNEVMKAQDSISSRIQTFPIPNIDKLEDVLVQVPKVIILNK